MFAAKDERASRLVAWLVSVREHMRHLFPGVTSDAHTWMVGARVFTIQTESPGRHGQGTTVSAVAAGSSE